MKLCAGGAPVVAPPAASRCRAHRRRACAPLSAAPHRVLPAALPALCRRTHARPRAAACRAVRAAAAAEPRTERYALAAGYALKLSVASAPDTPGAFAITARARAARVHAPPAVTHSQTQVWTDLPGRVMLHWGLLQPASVAWACPPASVLAELIPAGSRSYQARAAQYAPQADSKK